MDLTSPYSLSSNDIKTIYQDTNGDIWIGTAGGGLDKYIEAREGTSDQFLSLQLAKECRIIMSWVFWNMGIIFG